MSAPGSLEFICQNGNQTKDKYLNLLITIQGASLFITLQEEDASDTSIQIKNNTQDHNLLVHQYGVANSHSVVKPKEKIPFAWLQPCLNNIVIVRLKKNNETSSEIKCQLSEINKNISETVLFGSKETTISYHVSLHGRARVIKFYIGKDENEAKEEEFRFLFRAMLPALGVSLISAASNKKYELAYISLTPFLFVVVDKNDTTAIQVRIKAITIDNNMRYDVLYPVTMFPQNLKKLQERDLPYLDFICKIKNRHKKSDVRAF